MRSLTQVRLEVNHLGIPPDESSIAHQVKISLRPSVEYGSSYQGWVVKYLS